MHFVPNFVYAQFDNDPVIFDPAPADLVARLQEFASRLLDDETALYRKRSYFINHKSDLLRFFPNRCIIVCNYVYLIFVIITPPQCVLQSRMRAGSRRWVG